MFDTRKIPHLEKSQIQNLPGGKKRGKKVFVAVSQNGNSETIYSGKLRLQCQSQNQSRSHPEGYEPIETALGLLVYDIARGTVEVPVFRRWSGKFFTSSVEKPARLLVAPPKGSLERAILERRSKKQEIRDTLLRLIYEQPELDETVAEWMADHLGFPKGVESAKSALSRIEEYYLDELSVDQQRQCIELLRLGSGKTVVPGETPVPFGSQRLIVRVG